MSQSAKAQLALLAQALGIVLPTSIGPRCIVSDCRSRPEYVGHLRMYARGKRPHTGRIDGLRVCGEHRHHLPEQAIADRFWAQMKDGYYLREGVVPERKTVTLGWTEISKAA